APAAAPTPLPAGAKIAYINPQAILQGSVDGKAGIARIQALTTKKQGELQQRQKGLNDNQKKLQESGGVMSEAARGALEKEIERQNTELQRFQQDAQQEIQELQNEVQNDFGRKVQPIIEALGVEKGLHLILNLGDAGITWAVPGLDISADVI